MASTTAHDTTAGRHYVPKVLGLLLVVALMVYLPVMLRGAGGPTDAQALKLEVQRMASVVPCPADVEDGLMADGPTPMILMSLGRSGSGSTWQIIGNLTGMETPSVEYTGSGATSSEEFFQEHQGDKEARWMLDYLRNEQDTHPEAAIVGFKWKPFATIFSDESIAALRHIAARRNVKVVRSKRNLLDVHISGVKHYEARAEGGKVRSHCKAGDEKCLQKHLEVGTGLQVPTENLIDTLTEMTRSEEAVDHLLQEMGVPHVSVSYERLYYGDDASEWERLFQFLGRGPTELTMDEVRGAMDHVDTSVSSHKVALKNYDEIRELFDGTEFLALLH